MNSIQARFALLAALIFSIAGCGDDYQGGGEGPINFVSYSVVDWSAFGVNIEELKPGDTLEVRLKLKDANGSELGHNKNAEVRFTDPTGESNFYFYAQEQTNDGMLIFRTVVKPYAASGEYGLASISIYDSVGNYTWIQRLLGSRFVHGKEVPIYNTNVPDIRFKIDNPNQDI